jgi:hypothetical protein
MLDHRNVINGLEGCGKSSTVFQLISEQATPERPALFGFKNYELMTEQVNTWSERFKIPVEQFAICGHNLNYFPAYEAYTNKENPGVISKNVRFVLTSQANIQRQHHNSFYNLSTNNTIEYSHIVQDEFDFTSGILPSLDYEFNNLQVSKNSSITKEELIRVKEFEKLNWIEANYTKEDRNKIAAQKYLHNSGFTIASWIENCECPLTFLTSETLAANLLELIGFEKKYIGEREFEDCIVNIWSSPLITRSFFNVMNNETGWDRLSQDYDLVISDCVNSYFKNGTNSLNIEVLTHSSARGTNAYINSRILTVLSHIPNDSIQTIRDCFDYFGKELDFNTVEATFYRDRLCQAIGRVIGYRGSKETDVVIHSAILQKIQNLEHFPYKLNTDWELNLDEKEEILEKVINEKEKSKTRKKTIRDTYKAKSYKYLNDVFQLNKDSFVPIPEIKQKTQLKTPATKIAKFFNVNIKNKKIEGKSIRCLIGLEFKNA